MLCKSNMRLTEFRAVVHRCFCHLKWVTIAVFPAPSSETFYTTAPAIVLIWGCSLWNSCITLNHTHCRTYRKLNLATSSPELLPAVKCYPIIHILLSSRYSFLDITVTDTMAIILVSFTQICRAFDSRCSDMLGGPRALKHRAFCLENGKKMK